MYGAVLVSHDKDYKALAPRVAIGERQRFRKLSRIALTCSEPQAANRINEALSLIEHEWSAAQGRSDKRILVEIGMSLSERSGNGPHPPRRWSYSFIPHD